MVMTPPTPDMGRGTLHKTGGPPSDSGLGPKAFLDLGTGGIGGTAVELSAGSERRPPAPSQPLSYWLAQPPSDAEKLPEHPLAARNHSLKKLTRMIVGEIHANLYHLLSLNHSRREALAHYLEQVAGLPPSPSYARGLGDAGGGLRRWVEGPRTPTQERALETFLEEVALTFLGSCLVLKHWSDIAIRPWSIADLRDLNWAISQALRSSLPLDREAWQLTRPNLYSWYKPSTATQEVIWTELSLWDLKGETPDFLYLLVQHARQAEPDWPELRGFDPRLLTGLLEYLRRSGKLVLPSGTDGAGSAHPDRDGVGFPGLTSQWNRQLLQRKRTAFTPTLRDGSLLRATPAALQWSGMEGSLFQLTFAELGLLWTGPQTPPLWAQGLGIEAHPREQMQLEWNNPKPSSVSRMSEMEAFEFGWVLEERCIRLQSRTPEAIRFRAAAEGLSYFKKMREPLTTLGDLQACITLTKLRPGAVMFWLRQEALTADDGMECLRFLLSRARLIAEIDLSGLEHQLPSRSALYPPHLYIWERDSHLESRQSHRPLLIRLHGTLRSHVEISTLWSDLTQALLGEEPPVRSSYRLMGRQSPTPQSDWLERWPDPTSSTQLERIEALREHSIPLGQLARVRSVQDWVTGAQSTSFWQHSQAPERDAGESLIWVEYTEGNRARLRTAAGPSRESLTHANGMRSLNGVAPDALLIHLAPEDAHPALRAYLESALVQQWFELQAERRGNRCVLKEHTLKLAPVPNVLIQTWARSDEALHVFGPSTPERLTYRARELAQSDLKRIQSGEGIAATDIPLKCAQIFVLGSRIREHLVEQNRHLLQLVRADGEIEWSQLMEILPEPELLPFTVHPSIRQQGTLPPHLPITHFQRTKFPMSGITCRTDGGFHRTIHTEDALLLEMLWHLFQQILKAIPHPTWGELVETARLPRDLEMTRQLVSEILKSHGEESARIQDLQTLLSSCLECLQGPWRHTLESGPPGP